MFKNKDSGGGKMRDNKCLKDLNLANGVYLGVNFLIKDEDDLEDFKLNYWLGTNDQCTSLNNYKKQKMNDRDMKLNEFLILYQGNAKEALEELFMQPVYDVEVKRVESSIKSKNISLEKLYSLHMKSPLYPLSRFLLDWL